MPHEDLQIVMNAKDILKKGEFVDYFEKVLKMVLEMQKKQANAIENLERTYANLLAKMQGDSEVRHNELKGKTNQLFVGERLNEMSKHNEMSMAEIKKIMSGMLDKKFGEVDMRMSEIKDGERGPIGMPGPIGPMPKEHLILMKEVQEELKKVKNVLSNIPRGRAMGRAKVPIMRAQNLTSQIDGVVNEFTLDPDTTNVLGVFSTQFPVNFNAGTDWTFAGRTLTLVTTQVGVPQSGQTLWALTEVLFYP